MPALSAGDHGFGIESDEHIPHSEPGRSDRVSEVNPTQLALRLNALAVDERVTDQTRLLSLWRDLTQGRRQVADGFFTSDRCYLLLSTNPIPARPLDARRLAIIEAVLRGAPQKCIAIDHALAPSTIALHAKLALEALGVSSRPSHTHPLLNRIARSASKLSEARCSVVHAAGGRELRVVSMARPELALSALLPSAEFEVIQSLVEGHSYQDIAERRDTSARTVANQISAVFRRLQVSGRNALVERLFVEQEARSAQKGAE